MVLLKWFGFFVVWFVIVLDEFIDVMCSDKKMMCGCFCFIFFCGIGYVEFVGEIL